MESPEAASEMACPIVLQAVVSDLQGLLSLPLTPLTYHVVLAKATGARAENSANTSKALNVSLSFIIFLPLGTGNFKLVGELANGVCDGCPEN
jgi:hypothetical protein